MHDRAIQTRVWTSVLSPTEVCRPAGPARSHLLDAGSRVEIFCGHAVPTEVGRPADLRQLDSVPNTRSDDADPANCLGPFELNFRLLTPARTASTVRLLSGYCPANSNHGT